MILTRLRWCLFLVASAIAVQGISQTSFPLYTPEALEEDFALFRRQLERCHVGLYTYTSKEQFDQMLDEVATSLDKPMSGIDFFLKLIPLLRSIGNNHTDIRPSQAYTDFLLQEALRFPFRMHAIRDTLFIFADESAEFVIGHGRRINRINGILAADILEHMMANISTDGYNETLPRFIASYRFSRMYAYLYGYPEQFDIEYFGEDGILHTATIKALKVEEINTNRIGRIEHQVLPEEASNAFAIRNGIGVLTVPSFLPQGQGAEGAMRRFFKKSFATLAEQNTQSLLLDLRYNGGGYPEAMLELLSYLIDRPVEPYAAEYSTIDKVPEADFFPNPGEIKHFNRLPKRFVDSVYQIKGMLGKMMKPKSQPFTGRLYVLMNAQCASATSEFLGLVKTHTNAVFIGEEPGGNSCTQVANDMPMMVLPNTQVKVTLPLVKSVIKTNWENDGYGIQPDVEIYPTIEELIAKRDDLLERVLAWIAEQ